MYYDKMYVYMIMIMHRTDNVKKMLLRNMKTNIETRVE